MHPNFLFIHNNSINLNDSRVFYNFRLEIVSQLPLTCYSASIFKFVCQKFLDESKWFPGKFLIANPRYILQWCIFNEWFMGE